jgi:RNA polymerase sigma-70 factor (ECF subfamily)
MQMNIGNDLIPTRQSLLSRLKDWNDEESWKVFFDTYWKLIYNAAMQAGLTKTEAEDVVQETIISVLKRMPAYNRQKGSFKKWLLTVTSWRITDQLRKRQRGIKIVERQKHETSTSTKTDTLERFPDPVESKLQKTWDEDWEKNLFEAAVERVKRRIDPAQYQLFDLYIFRKWPARKIAETLKVNPGKIYLAKHRVGRLIKKEINYLQTKLI